jgi:hypothetical protein
MQISKAKEKVMEVKYDTTHHSGATPEARIANRLRNSGNAEEADHHAVHGTGPTRAHTNVHEKGNVMQRGPGHPGEGSITGHKRDTV